MHALALEAPPFRQVPPARGHLRLAAGTAVTRSDAYRRARAAHPRIELDYRTFARHVEQLGCDDALPDAAATLYLCCACGRGNPLACALLEARYFPAIQRRVARVLRDPNQVEEVLQLVRDRLLAGAAPRILSYAGRGGLRRWLEVLASRLALDEMRRARRRRKGQDELARHVAATTERPPGADTMLFLHRHAPVVSAAVRCALSELSGEERRMLSLAAAGGLGIDALGARFGIHRSTAARRLSRSRRRVAAQVHQYVEARLGPTTSEELGALLRALQGEAARQALAPLLAESAH